MKLLPQSFGAKLLALFMSAVGLTQFATWAFIREFNDTQARELINDELDRTTRNFARVTADRNSLLAAAAATAARDYAVKSLFAGEDDATLATALKSIRISSTAGLVTALSLEGKVRASTLAAAMSDAAYADLVRRAQASPEASARGYGLFGGELYSLVLAPVHAPDIIAWIAVGFRIDDAFARRLKEQTGIDLTFFDPAGRPVATTLAPAVVRDLAAMLPALHEEASSEEAGLAGTTALVRIRRLAAGGDRGGTLALQYSLEEKLAPAAIAQSRQLLVAVGGMIAAILLSLAFARGVTQPIVELVGHTRRITRGDYSIRNRSYRTDELGRLSEAFDQMSLGLSERDRVRDLLDKNVSPEVAAQLLRDGATLGGEEREVTILFADLRGFTTLSEHLPPRELLTLLNRYLDRMSAEIEHHGGVIDKFIGDAIMALFGAPVPQGDAARRAVSAALAMERALVGLNAELAAEGRPPLAIGVGVNTARVVAGNIGSQRRLNYSVIGDGVNVASRLQSLTRTPEYRTNVIVSAATLRAAQTPFPARPLGTVAVKGRAEPVEIFAVEA